VIKHVASGAEVRRIDLPVAGDDWYGVSFDMSSDFLVVNLHAVTDDTIRALVYDLRQVDPDPVWLSVDGEAYLTLAPVTVRGPIPAP